MPAPAPTFPDFRMVTVRNPTADSLLVRWAIVPTSYDMGQIVFEILRSNGPRGPWSLIGESAQGSFHYVDSIPMGLQSFRSYYYRVRAADISGKGYRDSVVASLDHDADNIALGMIRKKNVFLRTRGGISAAVLLRKRWGPKCSRCFDEVRQLPRDADCKVCFGTGFTGGYQTPVFVHAALFNQALKTYVTFNDARYDAANSTLELANLPVLSPDDIVVDRVVNARYIVKEVTPFTHRMYTVCQYVKVVRKDDNDVVYTIPIPEDLPSIQGKSYDLARSDA